MNLETFPDYTSVSKLHFKRGDQTAVTCERLMTYSFHFSSNWSSQPTPVIISAELNVLKEPKTRFNNC